MLQRLVIRVNSRAATVPGNDDGDDCDDGDDDDDGDDLLSS